MQLAAFGQERGEYGFKGVIHGQNVRKVDDSAEFGSTSPEVYRP
jgi:hypothetical protein